ncbi:MAG TPA: AMIN domain-containing protein [Syntrophobacteria bacterium]|nr:AMIN domain-containing protein [Syntrophobacteria bacterium]
MKFGRGFPLAWLVLWMICGIGCATPFVASKASQDALGEKPVLAPDTLKDIRVVNRDVHLIFTLSDSTWRTYTALEATDPFRVIVALPNTTTENVPTPLVVGNEIINRIETALVASQPQPYTRVVIELKHETTYRIERVGQEIVASFDPAPGALDASSSEAESASSPGAANKPHERSDRPEKNSPSPAPAEPTRLPSGDQGAQALPPARTLVAIEQRPASEGVEFRIVTDGSLAKYDAFHLTDPPRVVVDLFGLGSSQMKGEIPLGGSLVKKVRVGFHAGKVRVVFDLIPPRGVAYRAAAEGDHLVVTFKPGSGFPSR